MLSANGWVFVSVLPCTNVQIIDKAQWQNSTNTLLGVVRFQNENYDTRNSKAMGRKQGKT